MIPQVRVRYMALALLFTFCQVIGTMCVLPDLSEAKETPLLVEDHMACPMDGNIMCPPSLTSSPERQAKPTLFAIADHSPVLHNTAPSLLTVCLAPPPWSRDSTLAIVPIPIASSSVLRI